MKTKLFLLLSLVAISITITSCKKEEGTPNGKVKTVTLTYPGGGSGTTTAYTYDAEGKLTFTENSVGYRTVFTWTSGLLTIMYYQPQENIPYDSISYQLGSNGYAVSNSDGDTFTFDSEGHLTNKTTPSTIYTYNYSNGNLVNSVSASSSYTTNRTYQYSDKNEYRNSGLWFIDGKGSKNLATSGTTIGSGGSPYTLTITYDYDSKGSVIHESRTYSSLGTYEYSYTYFD